MNPISRLAVGKKRKPRTPGTVRVVVVFLALCAQLLLMAYMVLLLRQTVYLYFYLQIAGAVVMTVIITRNRNSSYTIAWLIIMMIMPVFGYLLFFLWGTTGLSNHKRTRIKAHIEHGQTFLTPDQPTHAQFLARHPARKKLGTYLQNEGFPIYQHTQSRYFPLGELQFEQLTADLEQAQKYIFLEYFIIAEGQLWDRIHDVLRRKARQGVEVRILIDDMGSIDRLPDTFVPELQSEGIQAARFNQVNQNIFRLLINNRDHQKITVIDGNIGYTGGTNIADEYVNLTHPLGQWKDVAIRLEGAAVWALTVTFLQMWDAETDLQSDYLRYRPTSQVDGRGFYQPFADGPINRTHQQSAQPGRGTLPPDHCRRPTLRLYNHSVPDHR
ncbi:MAG: phospholipase D-like domain-containing protein [Firmicutes bacterium]|nr:phospholipase D-like domain-containing protein [Bacillota bacterium]